MKVADLLRESEDDVSRAKLSKLKPGDKITGHFITRKKPITKTLTLAHPARERPVNATQQMWEWITEQSNSSIEIALDGNPMSGQFVVTKIESAIKEDSDEKLGDDQLSSIGGRLEDTIEGVIFDVTAGHSVDEDTYKVFFTWEAGDNGEHYGKGTATVSCGFQTQGRHFVAVDFKLKDLTGLRGIKINQGIFQ